MGIDESVAQYIDYPNLDLKLLLYNVCPIWDALHSVLWQRRLLSK